MAKYYLPGKDFPEPERFIRDLIKDRHLNNIRLWLDKFCLFDEKKKKGKFDIAEQVKSLGNGRLSIPPELFSWDMYISFFNRMESLHNSLEKIGYCVKSGDKKIRWRLVVGLGSGSVYETGLTLDRNYSIPIIPGCAVKGVARHYVEEHGKMSTDEIDIFGTQNKKGKVIFFDALPIIEKNTDFIVLDVMNVHYKDYYQKSDEAPGDWMDPNPIFFLTVEGLRFRFTVAAAPKDEKLAEKALEILKEALSTMGIGAKTAAGYGYFG